MCSCLDDRGNTGMPAARGPVEVPPAGEARQRLYGSPCERRPGHSTRAATFLQHRVARVLSPGRSLLLLPLGETSVPWAVRPIPAWHEACER